MRALIITIIIFRSCSKTTLSKVEKCSDLNRSCNIFWLEMVSADTCSWRGGGGGQESGKLSDNNFMFYNNTLMGGGGLGRYTFARALNERRNLE